jgi:hypothetical protein
MMELCSRRDFASNQRQAWCPVIFKRSLPWKETAGARKSFPTIRPGANLDNHGSANLLYFAPHFWGEMIASYTTVELIPTLPLRGLRSVLVPRPGRSSSKPPVGPYQSKWITNGIVDSPLEP